MKLSWKNNNSLRSLLESLKENSNNRITVYAGVNHFDYEDPIFTTSERSVANCDFTAKASAPIGTWVCFKWNDEVCSFSKTKSPKEKFQEWKKIFEDQQNDSSDLEFWVLESSTGYDELADGTYISKQDCPTPEDACWYVYDTIKNSYPDGDSSFGIIWEKIEDFVK